MRFIKLFAAFFLLIPLIYSQWNQDENYHYLVDISKVNDDQISVELIPPKQSKDVIFFRLPAVIPGSYVIHNFGRFITKARAYDDMGKMLSMSKVDGTSWMIMGATNLSKIEYKIDDTFDDNSITDKVFEPSGTSFEEGAVFLINTFCMFGYIDGQIDRKFNITFVKPSDFHASTCLNFTLREPDRDIFLVSDYKELMDNPILYCNPDTTTLFYDDATVLVSVYSKTKRVNSSVISNYLNDVLSSHRKILGGKLPVDKYAFLFYLFDPESSISVYGAHEHLRSSVYFMPDSKSTSSKDMIEFSKNIREFAAHEYYHLITPLRLQSEELTEFNLNKRSQMSRHLWLYEGVTEYMAHYSLLRNGFLSMDDFRKTIQRKMNNSEFYDKKVSFTEMSLNVHDKYQNEFTNVYQKGALIGLCLDILIRDISDGMRGLPEIISALIEKYGENRPFKDEELFSEIESLTSPKVGDFLKRCVSGTDPLPYKEILPQAGFKYSKIDYRRVDFGNSVVSINLSNLHPWFLTVDESNKFCRDLGLLSGDEIVGINGRYFLFVDYSEVFGSPEDKVKDGEEIEFIVRRMNPTGGYFYTKLEAKISGTIKTSKFKLFKNDKMTERDLKIQKAWLGE
ncbi:MAG: hypothetical protein L0Y79_01925 [Chlorobi bacterium]|nr:hypothetical protein [Chlorobiota bacterium]MCI0715260.1 hypothetical protein [Chlorobiota bacterium]